MATTPLLCSISLILKFRFDTTVDPSLFKLKRTHDFSIYMELRSVLLHSLVQLRLARFARLWPFRCRNFFWSCRSIRFQLGLTNLRIWRDLASWSSTTHFRDCIHWTIANWTQFTFMSNWSKLSKLSSLSFGLTHLAIGISCLVISSMLLFKFCSLLLPYLSLQ